MKIYKNVELESIIIFIEIINTRKFNIIVGVIYKHPKMDVTDSNNNWNNLLKNINQEQKQVLLLGVFNVDLMYFNEREPSNEFLDSLASNSYLSYIIQPSRHKVTIFSVMSSIVCIGVSHPPSPLTPPSPPQKHNLVLSCQASPINQQTVQALLFRQSSLYIGFLWNSPLKIASFSKPPKC